MNPELSSPFCHACSNLKRACCVEWALQNPQSSLFKKLYKYKADRNCFSNTCEKRGKILTGLKLHLSVRSFFLWTGTIFDSLRESGNLPDKIASLTQEVKYSKVNPLSFKILIGISPAVALFEGKPSITSFTA